ncbi:MAG TPA: hypothetical protein VMT68_16965 [Caulobacteraceae bacterium]|nr:hypothetical protein [Caulobacteraceae bacterium]
MDKKAIAVGGLSMIAISAGSLPPTGAVAATTEPTASQVGRAGVQVSPAAAARLGTIRSAGDEAWTQVGWAQGAAKGFRTTPTGQVMTVAQAVSYKIASPTALSAPIRAASDEAWTQLGWAQGSLAGYRTNGDGTLMTVKQAIAANIAH